MKDWQAFIFDFDGVLVDSLEVKTSAFAKLFESYGPELVNKVVDHHHHNGGMSRFDKFRFYYREFLGMALSEEKLDSLSTEFSRLVVDKVVASPEIDGVSQFLSKYSSIIHCFIISGTPENELKEIIIERGWSKSFKDILGSPASKKNNLKYILSKYQLNPKDCIFFGDAPSDYDAAISLDVSFLGIAKNSGTPLLKYVPDISWEVDFYGVEMYLKACLKEYGKRQ